MNPLENIFRSVSSEKKKRFWLVSDLQQHDPRLAEKYFSIALEDMRALEANFDEICYLGDAAEGVDRAALDSMIELQIAGLESFGVPINYVMGNHEMDYFWRNPPEIPYYNAVHGRPLWRTIPRQDVFWFAVDQGDFVMLFFSDHGAEDGSWGASHQFLPQDSKTHPTNKAAYPYTAADWIAVRDKFAACGKPVFTFAHCAFPGGNRPSQYLEQMLPLPPNFRAHFSGHAHIGDELWAGKDDLYRQIAVVNGQGIIQFDIASLDHFRGSTVRSAIFDYYGDGSYGVFFRDHLNRRWENSCISAHDPQFASTPERKTL